MNHKHDMIVRLQQLHYDNWYHNTDSYAKSTAEYYRDAILLHRVILKSVTKQERRYKNEA